MCNFGNTFYQRISITNFQGSFENKSQPSMAVIKRVSHRLPVSHFSCVHKNFVIKELRNLDINKATQDIDILIRILKENAYFFTEYNCTYVNDMINSTKFQTSFNLANLSPAFRNWN